MNDQRPTWNAVLSIVPEARSVPDATSTAVTEHVSQLPRPSYTDTPARLLAEVLTVAAGPARDDIRTALHTDGERRTGMADVLGGSMHRNVRLGLSLVMFLVLVLPMPGSHRYGGDGEPLLEVQPAVLICGTVSVIAFLGFAVLLSRAPVNSASILFPAFTGLLGFDLLYSLHRTKEESYNSYLPLSDQVGGPLLGEIIGLSLMLIAVIGFAVLTRLARRRPSAVEAAYSDSEDGRMLDEKLLTDVRRVIGEHDDVHLDTLRIQAVAGVHALFDRGRVDVLQASRMLREILEHYPVART